MDDFQRELLARLPLGQSVLILFAHSLNGSFLDSIYEANRGRCYEDALSFPVMMDLIRDALLVHEGSGRAGFQQAQKDGTLPTTLRAVYAKLGRMPLAVSQALLRQGTARLAELLPEALAEVAPGLPGSLAGMQGLTLDGKVVKHVQKRLKALRTRRGKVNSGKFLAALDWSSGLVTAIEGSPNSEANDVSLVGGLLGQLGPAPLGQVRLFIADRQFCDLVRLAAFRAGGHHFLVRHNRNLDFHVDPQRAAVAGVDRQGRRYVQEWGWLGAASHPLRRYVRRITVSRPSDEDVAVVSDLLDAAAYPAQDLLDAYLGRWNIEALFQQVTEVFDLRHLIGGTPQATLFQASFCLLLYNMVQVLRRYVALAGQQKVSAALEVSAVSTETLFEDCKAELVSWATVGDPAAALEALSPPLTTEQARARLQGLLGGLWDDRWLKTTQTRHGRTVTTIYPKKGYTNVWKVLQEHQEARRKSKRMAMQETQRCS